MEGFLIGNFSFRDQMPLSQELSLYRSILGAARRFPSIKRHKIVEEIRQGFRDNKNATGDDLQTKLSIAVKGLSQLEQYTFSSKSTAWSVNLEQNPMPGTPRAKADKED